MDDFDDDDNNDRWVDKVKADHFLFLRGGLFINCVVVGKRVSRSGQNLGYFLYFYKAELASGPSVRGLLSGQKRKLCN